MNFHPRFSRASFRARARGKEGNAVIFFSEKNHGAVNSGKPRKTGVSICFEAMHFGPALCTVYAVSFCSFRLDN
ncbi:hypothetical protein XB02_06485 [Pantoea ananatis]|nr:hypothetical protein XB02_06485 [Pantoea ananatis]